MRKEIKEQIQIDEFKDLLRIEFKARMVALFDEDFYSKKLKRRRRAAHAKQH